MNNKIAIRGSSWYPDLWCHFLTGNRWYAPSNLCDKDGFRLILLKSHEHEK